jgi:hypothetical protein
MSSSNGFAGSWISSIRLNGPRVHRSALAEADLEQAANWYNEEQEGLGSRFLSDVDQVFERIRERPQQFPAVSGNIRRALLRPLFPVWQLIGWPSGGG